MKNYKKFVLEKLNDNVLDYFCFDWDDNILVMPTVIHVEHLVDGKWIPTDLSTAQFAEIRNEIFKHVDGEESSWKLRNDSYRDTYCEFRDYGPRGGVAFIQDMISAVKSNSYGPVWDKFLECLIDGHVFMIITARGHEPKTIRLAVKWIISNCLNENQRNEMVNNLKKFNKIFDINDEDYDEDNIIDEYLDMCDFVGIYSSYFSKKYGTEGQSAKPEKYKSMAIRSFTEKVNDFGKQVNRKVRVGFSDDDLSTAQHVHKYLKDELSLDFPLEYTVYHTKDGIVKL